MNRRDRAYWLALFILVAALGWLLFATHAEGAVTKRPPIHRLAPPVPCTSKNRMDVFIDEDNILWECTCEILVQINICHWQVIGGVDSPEARRFLRQHPLSRMYFARRGYTIPPIRVRIA